IMLSLSNKKLFLLFSKNNLYKYDIIIIQDTLPPLAHQLPVHCVHIDLLQTSPGRAKLTKT
ncbi:hypothetical protein EJ854_13430, partial [Salmonella enterica subsp. enterica serovar Infantis]|nr:hypothetical protein [Salmonella enterica]EBC9329661.1 hypothetical protein [Salmonella enterica subsp. enterica serovar Infantis]EBC9842077.1 hypothetical protein [Salmonella enterica subsp. enterica serovar Infantis]EBN8442162.1 hypothetical protein [Salmonella enterica]ECU0907253.1 hypothetical protein [Salmonella enterica subsp. enterica serovar Infantis]